MDGRRIACDRCGAEVGAEERHAEIEYVYGDGGGGMTLCRDCFKLVMDTVHGQDAKRQGDAESPSTDERRAVALRMRGYDCPVLPSQQTTMEAVDAVVECMGLEDDEEMCTVRHFLDRLADLIDPGEGMDEDGSAVLDWVREHGGLDEVRRRWERLSHYADPVPRSCMEKRLARLQRQIDESHAALRRRNRWIAELEHLLCKEMSYSLRRDAGCLAPEALDADGKEIRVGDTVWHVETGEQCKVVEVDSRSVSVDFRVDGDGTKHTGSILPANLTHRAPVLAADGKPIRKGDTVWYANGDGLQLTVVRVEGDRVVTENARDGEQWWTAHILTHEQPDSWERLEEDAGKEACEYFAHMPCGCETSEMLDESVGKCNAAKARDLVRRARALAERWM